MIGIDVSVAHSHIAQVENATDRNSTALAQYQMQVETTALVGLTVDKCTRQIH